MAASTSTCTVSPTPPLVEVTVALSVPLPVATATTFTVTVQLCPTPSVAPERMTVEPPDVAATLPPEQVVVAFAGSATLRMAATWSMKPTPVSETGLSPGLVMVYRTMVV